MSEHQDTETPDTPDQSSKQTPPESAATPDTEQSDMMSMFASVWVKVEVQDDDNEANMSNLYNQLRNRDVDRNPFVDKPKKKKRARRFNKTFQCDQCEYVTIYKNCLELHIMGHTNTKPYSCDTCQYTTKYPTALSRHMMIQHKSKDDKETDKTGPQLPSYKCDQCDYKTFYKWNLNAHKRKHKLEKQYKCPHCTYETAYRHNFVKHSKVHNEGMFFKCDKCPFVTKFEGHITRHLAKIHNEVTEKANKCDFCDFSTMVRWRLNIHKQRSKQNELLKCTYCEYETFYNCQIKFHKVSHYKDIYSCSNVNRVTFNPNNTQNTLENTDVNQTQNLQNVTNYTNENPQNVTNFSNQNLQNVTNFPNQNENQTTYPHDSQKLQQTPPDQNNTEKTPYKLDPNCVDWYNIQVLESEDKDRPFLCHMCTYTSKFKASVQRHFQRHHTGSQNRPYKCCNCDFSTKTKDQIALHNKRSQSETQLFCVVCQFTTFYKCQYVMHQKCHYNYKCTLCEYSCKHKYELQKHHSMLHLGNALKCRFCDYKAMRKDSVLSHETIHTGVKPFNCEYCEYSSVRKSLLDNHVKRYHSDKKKDVTVVSESKIQSLRIPIEEEVLEQFSNENESQMCTNETLNPIL